MIQTDRLLSRLDELAKIGATERGGVNRPALSEVDREARAWLASKALARGFTVHTDTIANLFIRREGFETGLPPVLVGSHLDSQPSGGRFDGALGTLSAFECLEALEDNGVVTRFPIEVVAWTNEEGSRFAPGTMGSMVFAGKSNAREWQALVDDNGVGFSDELATTLSASPYAHARASVVRPHAYLELHIEQGPILEAEDVAIGVVTGVQGARWFAVVVDGASAHAGTTPLAHRHDALAAAVRIIAALQTIMAADSDARVTCGRIAVEPGSINAIPSRAIFTLDIRHPLPKALDAIEERLRDLVAQECAVRIAVERALDLPPRAFDGAIERCIETAAVTLGLRHRRLSSGAFHDALHLADVCPTGMIFVPCRGGISHNEAEFVAPAHVAAGARTLFCAVRALADGGP